MTWYSLLYLLAIAAGVAILIAEGRRRAFDMPRWAIAAAAWALGGMIGAELPHAILGDLAAAKTAVGAVAGATIALFVAAQLMGLPAGRALDSTATAIPLAGALARLGCFAAECCHGIATSLPIGVIGDDGVRRHPTQLYEAAFDVAVAGWISRAPRRADGHRFLASLAAMSAGRFTIELVRDSERIGPLSLAQWITGAVAIACFALLRSGVTLPQLRRPRPMVVGAATLALQMPAISADSLYPRNYVSAGVGWFGSAFDWTHDVGSCDVSESYVRTHKIGGMSGEAGFRRQLSATRGFGFRLRPFSATEDASETREHMINGGPAPGPVTPQPAYRLRHRGATLAGDLDFKYLGITFGGTFGQFYPLLDASDDYPGYRGAQEQWPSMGLRLGTQKAALEIRTGDEAPTGAPLPAFTVGLGIGDPKGTRIRLGASDMGPYVAGRHVTPKGTEISPMFGGAHDGWLAGVMVKQWFRVDKNPR